MKNDEVYAVDDTQRQHYPLVLFVGFCSLVPGLGHLLIYGLIGWLAITEPLKPYLGEFKQKLSGLILLLTNFFVQLGKKLARIHQFVVQFITHP